MPSRARRLVEHRARPPRSSATIGDHRQHDAALRRGHAAQDRAQLRARADRAARAPSRMPRSAERGIVLGRQRQIGHRLVAADIERADDQRAAAERVGDRRIGRALLVLATAPRRDRGTGIRCAAARSLRRPARPRARRRRASRDWRRPRSACRRAVTAIACAAAACAARRSRGARQSRCRARRAPLGARRRRDRSRGPRRESRACHRRCRAPLRRPRRASASRQRRR